jgi:hypothetical protein
MATTNLPFDHNKHHQPKQTPPQFPRRALVTVLRIQSDRYSGCMHTLYIDTTSSWLCVRVIRTLLFSPTRALHHSYHPKDCNCILSLELRVGFSRQRSSSDVRGRSRSLSLSLFYNFKTLLPNETPFWGGGGLSYISSLGGRFVLDRALTTHL